MKYANNSIRLILNCADGGGDVFVGGAVPFGMVKLGLDTYEEPLNQSALNGGWTPNGYVTGISLMHESGTGGGAKYGFPSQMPLTTIDGDVNLLDNRTYWQTRVRTFPTDRSNANKSIDWRRYSKCGIFPISSRVWSHSRIIGITTRRTTPIHLSGII